jgi:uncharacterized MAPEG superfamily protein
MTSDLKYLAYTAMLTATLWIPYVVSQVKTNGPLTPGNYKDPTPRPVPLWGKRADRAYLNAVEAFAPFAALVVAAQLTGKSRCDDGVLGDVLLLVAINTCGRVFVRNSIRQNARFHARLCRGRGNLLGSG